MALSVREPAIIAGRLRLCGDLISDPSEIEQARSHPHFDRVFVEVPDVEIPAVKAPQPPSIITKESD